MARGSLKGLRRRGNDKHRTVSNTVDQNVSQTQLMGDDTGGYGGWLNCECFFSLVLVGLLAALPFNLHTHELIQSKDTYISRAQELFSDGAFEKAANLYERAVSAEETAEGHVMLAETLVRVNRFDDAIHHYARAADMFPNVVEKSTMYLSLGKLYVETRRHNLAVQSFNQILHLPTDQHSQELADAHTQVAASLIEVASFGTAISHLQAASFRSPAHTAAQVLRASVMRDATLLPQSVNRYKRVIKEKPRDFSALTGLALSYYETGSFKLAIAMYRKALSVSPSSAEAHFALCALHAFKTHTHTRSNVEFVAQIFDLEARRASFLRQHNLPWYTGLDRYANVSLDRFQTLSPLIEDDDLNLTLSFESAFHDVFGLVFRGLRGMMTEIIEAEYGITGGARYRWLDVIDLGCGRGSVGLRLRGLADRLVGIDVSRASIQHATSLNLYDEIKHADAVLALQEIPRESVDLVVSVDTVPYFGDLTELFQLVHAVLRPGGGFIFNTDDVNLFTCFLSDLAPEQLSYVLQVSGRWAHSHSYVDEILQTVGFKYVKHQTAHAQTRLQMHRGNATLSRQGRPRSPIRGRVVLVYKPEA